MIVTHLNNIQAKLDEAAGGAVAVEMRMRLIGELDWQVRAKLTELVTTEHQKRMKKNMKAEKESDKYWKCKLYFLDNAIDAVLGENLDANNRKNLLNLGHIVISFFMGILLG